MKKRDNLNTDKFNELRKAQLRILEILEIVDKICKKHNIPYWLGYGTLLGAVRHGGFIPWDDDLDIALLRKDYKKLLKILPQELPAYLSLQQPGERYYDLAFAKIRDNRSEVTESHNRDKNYLQKGLFIDIFPLEPAYYPLKKFARFFFEKSYRHIRRRRIFQSPILFLKSIFYYLIWPLGAALVLFSKFIALVGQASTLVHGYVIKDSAIQDIETIFPLTEVTFEGKKFPAPGNYNRYLRTLYGDYMKLPPEHERKTHFEGNIKFYD
ncbi:MAG: LicD family protein [Bacteroidales bacterium]|jgi:lipopolysaccharide cholinephosphotransferase|nr:LicD family protein [Bacteroidales bacterium]